jgi:hypothetical protein
MPPYRNEMPWVGTAAPIAFWRILDHRANALTRVSGIGEAGYRFPRRQRAGQPGRAGVVFPAADALLRRLGFVGQGHH